MGGPGTTGPPLATALSAHRFRLALAANRQLHCIAQQRAGLADHFVSLLRHIPNKEVNRMGKHRGERQKPNWANTAGNHGS